LVEASGESLASAREYQLGAAREVLANGNSLVIMPTALGKTLVAALVAKELLSKKPKSKILFLAPTKPLVIQQSARLEKLLSLQEGQSVVITGEIAREKRAEIYADESVRVVCATPQTIENDLHTQNGLAIAGFSLVVFDEAHRSVGDYAYTAVASAARLHANTLLLGLTASPSADEHKVREICTNLAIKHVVSKQETDEDVAQYVQKIELDWKPVELPAEMKALRDEITALAQEPYGILRIIEFLGLTSGRPNKTQLLAARGRLAVSKSPARFRAMSLLARLMNLLHAQDLLESQGVSALHNYLLNLHKRKEESKAVRDLAADFRIVRMQKRCEDLIALGIDHPKLDFLLDLLKNKVSQSKSALVFAHYRDSVKNILERVNAQGIEAKVLVGKSGEGMSQKQQAQVVQEFRDKLFPVLVSTSIGEEGLDIPAVDVVVFYDAVPSEVRLIQRRGRTGRVRMGEAIMLFTKDTKDEAYHWLSRSKEKKMQGIVEKVRDEFSASQAQQAVEAAQAAEPSGQSSLQDYSEKA